MILFVFLESVEFSLKLQGTGGKIMIQHVKSLKKVASTKPRSSLTIESCQKVRVYNFPAKRRRFNEI